MSNILSYNKKTTGEGWQTIQRQYGQDDIEGIHDPDEGTTQKPRTAIPSPFAQMDLVKNAFKRLSQTPDMHGALSDERLVANALDVAQLFFNYPEHANTLRIIEWQRDVEIMKLKENPVHRLYGETLEMFLQQDKEAFNFDKMDRLYFLAFGNQVIGSTCPTTLFMATPNARDGVYSIPVEQNVNLFNQWRPLYERSDKFVHYIYAIFTAYPELKMLCKEMNAYLISCFRLLPQDKQTSIVKDIGNPDAFDSANVERARQYLETNYRRMDEGLQILGVPLYTAKAEDINQAIQESDFKIVPDGMMLQKLSESERQRLPLILQNRLNAPATDTFRYVTGPWDDLIEITPADYGVEPDKRLLPQTSHVYPWLTDADFFQPVIIKLDYGIDRDCFFEGNKVAMSPNVDDHDFLLPLKPVFFKYFKVSDLWGTINGRPRFELQHNRQGSVETVKAILRIPVQKRGQFITLQRTYVETLNGALEYDQKNDYGHIANLQFAVSVFPFVKTEGLKQYNVQLIDRALGVWQQSKLSLAFFNDGYKNEVDEKQIIQRDRSLKREKNVGSKYYRVRAAFDYMVLTLSNEQGATLADGVICPRWQSYVSGHDAFTFAVDFGTTNTHLECMRNDEEPEPLKIENPARDRLMATLYNGESILYDVIMKQEFLPKLIGADYGFPQRTVLSEAGAMDAESADMIIALGDANIPFIYEKESIGYGNNIVPNLKWSTEIANSKRVLCYMTELALLMRTKVLLSGGDLAKTRLVWFYPLSMRVGDIHKMESNWSKIFKEVFGVEATERNLIQMPESVAPYYFYTNASSFHASASTVASIDIGGGTSDIVVYEPNNNQPSLLCSFRFAANVLFGDGFNDPSGDTNPMLQKYVSYFKQLFDADDDKYGELNGILDDITEKRKSEDVNAFLFSIANNKATRGNDTFSYNMRLNEDGMRKIIFVYFYSTLIYYVARTMKHRKLNMPQSIMFSGTGSKVLDIVGNQRDLNLLTQTILEDVFGEKFGEDGFEVVMERKEPKQITCRGALKQVRTAEGINAITELNGLLDNFENPLKYNYSMLPKEQLCYGDMQKEEIKEQLINEVKAFNEYFISLCDRIHVLDRFLVDSRSLIRFKENVNKYLEHHLLSGWNFVNRNQEPKNESDAIEDTVFFYPIVGSIRDNLIQNLKETEI